MVERIRRLTVLAKEAGGTASRIPFLVMTSSINHTETQSFFEKNNFFGLPVEDVMFFEQGPGCGFANPPTR